jgi:hypothetical protein
MKLLKGFFFFFFVGEIVLLEEVSDPFMLKSSWGIVEDVG